MSQNEIHSKLKELEAAIRKQNEQIKNLENQKAAEKIKVDPSSSNNQIEDSIKMLSLVAHIMAYYIHHSKNYGSHKFNRFLTLMYFYIFLTKDFILFSLSLANTIYQNIVNYFKI